MIVVLKAHISGTLSLSQTSVAMFVYVFGQKTPKVIGWIPSNIMINCYMTQLYKYISVSGYACWVWIPNRPEILSNPGSNWWPPRSLTFTVDNRFGARRISREVKTMGSTLEVTPFLDDTVSPFGKVCGFPLTAPLLKKWCTLDFQGV